MDENDGELSFFFHRREISTRERASGSLSISFIQQR